MKPAILLAALMGTPLAATVESYTHGPFSLQTDGGRITLTRGGEVLVARDGTGKIPGPPADARWTVERGTGALTATLAYPRVIKRVILRERDAFIAFRLTTPPDQDIDKRSGVLYLLEVPKEAFAGGRLYAADVSNAKCGWRPGDAQLKIKDPKVIGVARDGERFEVQISTTMRRLWRAEARIPPEPTGTCQLRALFTIPRNQSAWMVFRFTTDPETPLPPDPDDPLHPETGNLFRDLASVADAGYAIALRRSLRAVFRGQTVRIDGLYVDRDAAERDVGYTWRVRDWRDRTVSEGRGRFASAGRGHLVQDIAEIACDRTGAFKLDLEATDGTTTLTRQTTFAVLPRPRWHGRRHDGFHGGHVGISTNDPWRLHLARMSGVTWTRLHDSSGIHEVYWRDLEPEEGRFVLEEPVILKAFKRANMNVDACLRNGCPAWVTERIMARLRSEHPDLSDEQLNKKLGSWYHHADAIALYKRFLRVMLEDRGHLIDALEPQNEIYYARNIQGQVNLTRATREVIDEVAPHIKLVGMNAPPASYGSDWAEWCRREGVGRVSDVIGAHFYVSRGIAALGSEKAMESWCLGLRRLFAAEDGGRPVWNTEWCTNFPTLFQDHPHHEANVYHPGDAALRLDSHMYAVVNVRQFIAMAVHGIKSFWHVYYTGSAMDRRLHEYDWTPNPAGVAFSAATAILDGAVFHDHWQACPDLRGYVVDTPRGAVAVTFGTRFLDEETASLVFPRTVAGASALDTMANAIGPLTAGTTLTIDNDPVYIVAPSMDAPALLAHLSEAVVTPPARGSIIAKFLFDGAEPGEADGIADEAGLYQLKRAGPGNAATSRGPLLLRDRVDRGPAAATFDYGDNLCLHGPPDCGAMFAMRARHRFAHVFDATDQAGMALTVEAWVKLGSPPKGRQWVSSVIFEKNRWRHAPQYRLYIDREGRARWTHSWGTGDETYVRLTGPVLPVGKWTHVAGTTEYDGTTMRCRLYVDGASVDASTDARRPVEAAFTPVSIGGGRYDPAPSAFLEDVSVDEIVVHRRAVPPQELGWFQGSRRSSRALEAGLEPATTQHWAGFLPIDLSDAANRGLRDEKSGDAQGGALDQGANDLRELPPGDWLMCGVPVRIIDPAANGGNAIVTLKGRFTPDLPERARIPARQLRIERLAILHMLGWGGRGTDLAVSYVLTHRDGRQSVIDCRNKIEVADWWYMGAVEKAEVAWTGANAMTSKYRLYLHTWQNPEPTNDVTAIEIVSAGGPTPVVLAMTALCMP